MIVALVLLAFTACDPDSTSPDLPEAEELVVVLNSTERSLTVFPVDDPDAVYTIGIAPEGSPTSIAVRGGFAVVPLGTYPFAAVVDLQEREVKYTVALPEGSGATGVAFINDSIALIANSDLNSVSPINVLRGTAGAAIDVGGYPQSIVVVDGVAYVINGELENWMPARPGSITLIDGSLDRVGTITLSGLNPGYAAVGADGRLYVVNAGSWGAENGSLSVVDLQTRNEIAHHDGFGDFPGSVAAAPGRILVGIYGAGVVEWDPVVGEFVRGPENPRTFGVLPPVSGLAFDPAGALYLLAPGNCVDPGKVYRIGEAGEVVEEVRTGACPSAIAFGQ